MRITPQAVTAVRTCAICERTLLVGERTVRYSPDVHRRLGAAQAQAVARRPLRVEEAGGRAGRRGADPAPSLAARTGDGGSGGPVQRERLPPHDRRDREEPR